MADSDNDSGGGHGKRDLSSREQDRLLPIANVSRIMKKALPANAKISKDAKETVQECVSEFISFITGEASDKCQREKRKTINGDDLLWAMTTLGFEDYVDPLKIYLQRFREMEGDKSSVGAARDKEGGFIGDGCGSGSANMGNSVGDYGNNEAIYGGMGSSMMTMDHHHQQHHHQQHPQGQVYGSGGFNQVTVDGTVSNGSGLGKGSGGVGRNGPGGSTGRPR